jgi:hypothetical protein
MISLSSFKIPFDCIIIILIILITYFYFKTKDKNIIQKDIPIEQFSTIPESIDSIKNKVTDKYHSIKDSISKNDDLIEDEDENNIIQNFAIPGNPQNLDIIPLIKSINNIAKSINILNKTIATKMDKTIANQEAQAYTAE